MDLNSNGRDFLGTFEAATWTGLLVAEQYSKSWWTNNSKKRLGLGDSEGAMGEIGDQQLQALGLEVQHR
ncbi:uncharacterized protein J3R85_003508 [Psidium guajava]|nr:uncharacterized protein J3R85_003508 [Psidium guajava]